MGESDQNERAPFTLVLNVGDSRLEGQGCEIDVVGGARGWLSLGEESSTLSLALPAAPYGELRFIVDRALRSLGSLKNPDRVSFHCDLATDLGLTLVLDLLNRFGDEVIIEGDEALAVEARRVSNYEDLYRDWVNEDPSTRTSVAIARDVRNWASTRNDIELEIIEGEDIEEKGLRLLQTVGQGSVDSPPHLVIAHYQPEGASGAPRAIVGKGITFDTGGINVKPYASFVSMMKNDMGGAAIAFALFKALVERDHPEPLLLVIPTCENAIGARSMRPGAVVESYRGKTVRIDHTDAEGRLVLADGIAYAQANYSPAEFFCFATLTTSALNSYGPYATPVHFANEEFKRSLEEAGQAMGEDFHFFPRRLWHTLANRDKEADLRNTARLPGNASAGAGSRNAAHFLIEFCDAPLTHFDIFASTWNWSGEAPGSGYGATGAPLRSLIRALEPSRGDGLIEEER